MNGYLRSCALAFVASAPVYSFAADDAFAIRNYEISGNQLLEVGQLLPLLAPFTGDQRTLADVRKAQAAIENAYRAAGYGAVRAVIPEQEVTGGVIRIRVVEARIRQVEVVGNRHFDAANVRAALPALREGESPNLRLISENIQLANENPTRAAEVLLSSLGEEGSLKASVLVRDSRPLRVSASLDNTGSDSTGKQRLGVALQHANLFDRDHVGTLAYTTSPERHQDVNIFSLSYRIPFYRLGDSLDLVYGRSDVQAATSQTVAGPLNFSGEGTVFAVRYNHYFPRSGEYSSRLSLGWDRRHYRNACDIGGVSCGAADADVTVRPLSLSYTGRQAGADGSLDYYLTLVGNVPGGTAGRDADFDQVRAGAEADYVVGRIGASLVRRVGKWQARLALNAQYSAEPLVPGEQFGLAGANAVRGFEERAVASDSGVVANLELFTPPASLPLAADAPVIRGVLFADAASGHNRDVEPGTRPRHLTLGSIGIGLRGEWRHNASLSLDLAKVVRSHPAADRDSGDLHAHFAINLLF